jgi:hypothetical protein
MVPRAVLTFVFALVAGSAAFAQLPPQPPPVQNPMTQGDARERAACQPDVIRFCKELVKDDQSDVFAILSCLQTNRTRISRACNGVLVSHGQ